MGGKPEGKGESEYERIRGEGKKWEMAGENPQKFPGLPWVWGSPWVCVWGGYGDDLPSPQTHGDSMGIFNQPEITR